MELCKLMEGCQEPSSPFRVVVDSFADSLEAEIRPVEAKFMTGREALFSMVSFFLPLLYS